MTEEDWNAEINRMMQHSSLTRQFVDGQLTPEDYQDGLAGIGHNPYDLGNLWDEGQSLLIL